VTGMERFKGCWVEYDVEIWMWMMLLKYSTLMATYNPVSQVEEHLAQRYRAVAHTGGVKLTQDSLVLGAGEMAAQYLFAMYRENYSASSLANTLDQIICSSFCQHECKFRERSPKSRISLNAARAAM
jgi:hypothetical protein